MAPLTREGVGTSTLLLAVCVTANVCGPVSGDALFPAAPFAEVRRILLAAKEYMSLKEEATEIGESEVDQVGGRRKEGGGTGIEVEQESGDGGRGIDEKHKQSPIFTKEYGNVGKLHMDEINKNQTVTQDEIVEETWVINKNVGKIEMENNDEKMHKGKNDAIIKYSTILEKNIEGNARDSYSKRLDIHLTLDTLNMSNLPAECWKSEWTHSLSETFVDNLTGIQTYCLRNCSSSCYAKLASRTEPQRFSQTIELTPRDRILILSPECVPSSGLFLHQIFQNFSDFLPYRCSQSFCEGNVWSNTDQIPLIYLDPSMPLTQSRKSKSIKKCYQALLSLSQSNFNVSRVLPDMRVNNTSVNMSGKLNCNSLMIVRMKVGERRVVLIVRPIECSSIYDVFFLSHSTKLYNCLREKAMQPSLRTNTHEDFFEDFLDRDLRFIKLPSSCVSLLCNDRVDLTDIMTERHGNVRHWFPYVKYCSGTLCQSFAKKFEECHSDLSATGDLWTATQPYLDNYSRPTLSLVPQCLRNSLEAKQVKLKAEILGRISIEDDHLAQECITIVCDAYVLEKGDETSFIFVRKYESEYPAVPCLKEQFETKNLSDTLTLYSYQLKKTNFTLVYVYLKTSYPIRLRFWKLIAYLYNESKLDMIGRCASDPYNIHKYSFGDKVYYRCITKSTPYIPSRFSTNDEKPWYKKKVGNINNKATYIVFFKNGSIPLLNYWLNEWLATLDTQFSKLSLLYLFPVFENSIFLYKDNTIIHFAEENWKSVGFQSFINDIKKAGIQCDQSQEFTVCYRRDTKFPITHPDPGYLFVFHKCVINPYLGLDQIILAVLSHFHDTGLTPKELCEKEHMAVTATTSKVISYETKGFPNEVAPVLNELKSFSPGLEWYRTDFEDPWYGVEMGICLQLREISQVAYILSARQYCVYYNTASVKIFMWINLNHTTQAALFPLRESSPLAIGNFTNKNDVKFLSFEGTSIIKFRFNPFQGLFMDAYEENPGRVLFLQRIVLKTLLRAIMTGNKQCYDDLSKNIFVIYDNGATMILGPVPRNIVDSSCFSSLPYEIITSLETVNKALTINKFWPTCLYNMVVMINDRNDSTVTDWWYLNESCKRNEKLLLSASIVVTIITLAGNIFVLAVMATSGLIHEATFMIRSSLASADLLMGLLPASIAVYDHVGLMTGRLTLRDLDNDLLMNSFPYIITSQSPGFQQLRFQRRSLLPVLVSFSFNVSAMVSLLTLALLSMERLYVMRGRPLSRSFMVRGVVSSWVAGVLLSFLVNWRKDGIDLAGYFDPVTKLTLNVGASAPSVSRWVFYLEISVMGVAGATVVICGVATVVLFISHTRRSSAILNIHSSNRDSDQRRTTLIFVLMVVMFMVAVVLLAVDVAADLAVSNPLAHWLAWWAFVAASSWNWALYTLSGGRFRQHIRTLFPSSPAQNTKGLHYSPHPQEQPQPQQPSFTRHKFLYRPRRKTSVAIILTSFTRTQPNSLNSLNVQLHRPVAK